MIWVIGDIHGMFDPLKRLITRIQGRQRGENPEEDKLIFIGDYIDYGPSSKEVIDYIMGLPFETVCMMGNHDDLLLQFIDNSDLVKRFGNVWFRGNGGQRTVSSFFPDKYYSDREEDMSPEDFPLEKKHLDFFRNLKITHVEELGEWKLAFVHAMFNHKFPVDEQLAIKTYDDFHAWRKENEVWIEDTLLWNRKEPQKRFGDYVLVHGHLPTTNLEHMWKELYGYDTSLELPFLKFETGEDEIGFHDDYNSYKYTASSENLISINTDTGAVYGNRLTAIGISEDKLNDSEILVYQVSTGKGYRLAEDFHISRISFNCF